APEGGDARTRGLDWKDDLGRDASEAARAGLGDRRAVLAASAWLRLGGRRRGVAVHVPSLARQLDRGRHHRGPEEHHRRAHPRTPERLGEASMDFGFSQEQEMLRTTARKFFENECTSTVVRQRMEEPAGVTEGFWPKLAEQGWLGLVYPEEYGGVGLGFVDLIVLMEEMGRAVMPGPFFSTLLGGLAILESGSAEQKKEWLPRITGGEAKATLAWTEPSARWDAAGVATTAKTSGDGWILSGTKLFVLDAHLADVTIVVARTAES